MTRTIKFGALALPILLLSGCAMQNDFIKAQNDDTVQSWAAFVQKYPAAQHPGCDECQAAQKAYQAALDRENAAWDTARQKNTPGSYLDYLAAYPSKGSHAAAARDDARSLLEKGRGAPDDYGAYLSRYPDDSDASGLRRELMRVRYRAARAAQTPDALELFAAEYPGTREASRAEEDMARQDFDEARKMKTRLGWDFFLNRFPRSPLASEARQAEAALPAAAPVDASENLLRLLPKLRQASPALQAEECLRVLSHEVADQHNPFGAQAEQIRGDFTASSGGLPAECQNVQMEVAPGRRRLVSAALKALIELSQRQTSLAALFGGSQSVAEKAKELGKSAAALSDSAEAFDLEMQAFYGYMPADPDHPHEKAANDAKEALRRAKAAFELSAQGKAAERKQEAAKVLRLMDRQKHLLIRLIADSERPGGLSAGGAEEAP